MPPGIAAFGDDEFLWIECLDVIAATNVFEIKDKSCKRFIEEPGTAAVRARGLAPDPIFQRCGIDGFEGGGQHSEIEWLVTKHEAQVRHDRIARGVLPGIAFNHARTVYFRPPCSRDQIALHGRLRDGQG